MKFYIISFFDIFFTINCILDELNNSANFATYDEIGNAIEFAYVLHEE